MKKFTKVLAMILALVLCMSSLAACSLFEKGPKDSADLLSKSKEIMAKEENANYHMDMNMGMSIVMKGKVEGEDMEMNIPIDVKAKFDITEKYMHGKMDMSMDMKASVTIDGKKEEMNESQEMKSEMYAVMDGDEITTYTKDDEDDTWYVSDEESAASAADIAEILEDEDFSEIFEKAKLESTKDGYTVSMKMSDLMESEAFEDLMGEMDMTDIGLGVDTDDLTDAMGDVNVKYTFDKDCRITGMTIEEIEIDLADVLGDAMSDSGIGGEEISKMTLTMEFEIKLSKFGEIDEDDVKVPKSVKEEAIEESDIEIDWDEDEDEDEYDEEDEDDPSVTPETKPTTPEATEPEETEPKEDDKPVVSDGKISDNWSDMDVSINGVVYHFPYDYDLLKSNGWYVDMKEYGYEDGYILNKGDSVTGTIDMYNDKYGKEYNSFSLWVGFKNFGQKAADILECDIWSFEADIMHGFKKMEKYPDVVIAKGITWGATEAEIIAAFGEWDDEYVSEENGYKTVDYVIDYSKYMKLTIYDEHGLTAISFKEY